MPKREDDYLFGKVDPGPDAAMLGMLQDVDDDYELLRGVPRAEGFPEDAYFQMDDDFPRNLLLEDVLLNDNKLLVVAERLRDALRPEDLAKNEVLPVRVLNHKGRAVREPYCILHQLELVDCIDRAASEIIVNDIDPELFFRVNRLVIDPARVETDRAVFRMKGYPMLPLFRRDLAERIQGGGFTGILFGELEDWHGS